MREEKTRLQMIVSIVMVGMIVLFGVLNLVSRFNRGAVFADSLLRQTTEEGRTVYSGKAYGESVEISVSQNDAGDMVEVVFRIGSRICDVCTLETGLPAIQTDWGDTVEGVRVTCNGSVIFDGGYDFDGSGSHLRWYGKDGTSDISLYTGRVVSGDSYWSSYETTPQSVMRFAQGPELVCRGSFAAYFMLVLLSLLLLLDVTHPTALFYLQHCCDVRDPEPSDFYLAMQRVGWVFYPVLLLVGYIMALRMLP